MEENGEKDEILSCQDLDISTYKPRRMEKKWRHEESLQLSIPLYVHVGLAFQYGSGYNFLSDQHMFL